MANVTFEELMNGFGVVTVMNACIYELKPEYRYAGRSACQHSTANGAFTPDCWLCTGEYLDTLKIANLTQEGPTKTVTGGQYANPLIKYGKTMTMEMQDALGRASTMVRFFGCDYISGKTYIKDTKYRYYIVGDGTTKEFFVAQKMSNEALASAGTWTVEDAEGADVTVTAAYDAQAEAIKVTFTNAPAENDNITIVFTPSTDTKVSATSRISVTSPNGVLPIEVATLFRICSGNSSGLNNATAEYKPGSNEATKKQTYLSQRIRVA